MSVGRLATFLAGSALLLACAIAIVSRAWRRGRGDQRVSAETLRRYNQDDELP